MTLLRLIANICFYNNAFNCWLLQMRIHLEKGHELQTSYEGKGWNQLTIFRVCFRGVDHIFYYRHQHVHAFIEWLITCRLNLNNQHVVYVHICEFVRWRFCLLPCTTSVINTSWIACIGQLVVTVWQIYFKVVTLIPCDQRTARIHWD